MLYVCVYTHILMKERWVTMCIMTDNFSCKKPSCTFTNLPFIRALKKKGQWYVHLTIECSTKCQLVTTPE